MAETGTRGDGRPVASLLRPLARVLDLVLPPRCLGCGILVEAQGALCPACWSGVTFLAEPLCRCCGLPFAYDETAGSRVAGAELECGACLAEPPPFARARAVMRYDDGSRPLLLGFKHGDRTEAAAPYADWMARSGRELLAAAEVVAPVPLHWRRLFSRRYNQAALLARALARSATPPDGGLTEVPDLLLRRRATPSQGRLTRSERQRNVAGAFAVNPRRAALLQGRRLLLVDDVMTTGATVAACSRAALKAGAAAVDVLVLARALRD
ncbi:ComF family protein [Pelagibius sp. CAU 1746]|uniref:ComF family protein n=1 Tax=Pelagibius sp. CAU 1746 TaxID=3140370 RepID=UPI00325B28D5